ncbi:MAG: hypothetical protein M3R01_01045, partial [Actinomycetota bacterium]|nr:hypothetical protein [Actinomycetota bacterium]
MTAPRWEPLASVRSRITVVASAAVVGVLVAAGVGLVVLQERSLTDQLEEALDDQASAIVALAEADALPTVLPNSGDDDTVSQVTSEDGEVLAASNTRIGSAEALADAPPAGEDPVLRTVEPIGGDDQTYRVLTQRVTTADGSVLVHVASPLDDVQESTSALVVSLVTTVPPVAAVLTLLIWWLVGRALRPVEAIRAEVAGMGAADLGRRVPVPGG